MSKGHGPWGEARNAWQALRRWHDAGSAQSGAERGAAALAALGDVGCIRRLLDQAELTAVQEARRAGKSWSEVAVALGVTRQSAWERWRDLDVDEPESEIAARPRPGQHSDRSRAVDAAAREVSRRARELRRRDTVRVPNVIGRTRREACGLLMESRLVGVGPDPDAVPAAGPGAEDVVTDQSPESGARVEPGSSVTLWTERGGGSGVREPRRPRTTPRAGRAMRDEESDEAVG